MPLEWPERALGAPVDIDGARHHVLEIGGPGYVARVFVDEATCVVRRIVEETTRAITTNYFAVLTPAR